jgi:hypothetical protein
MFDQHLQLLNIRFLRPEDDSIRVAQVNSSRVNIAARQNLIGSGGKADRRDGLAENYHCSFVRRGGATLKIKISTS